MKKIVLVFLISFLIIIRLFFFGFLIFILFGDPPAANVHKETFDNFKSVNKYTMRKVSNDCKMLSISNVKSDFVLEYDYTYGCGLLGDPSFCIYVKTEFEPGIFETEKQRVIQNSVNDFSISEEKHLYLGSKIDKTIFGLFVSPHIYDGLWILIDAAIIDEDNSNIVFVFALWQDNASHNYYVDSVVDVLKPYMDADK